MFYGTGFHVYNIIQRIPGMLFYANNGGITSAQTTITPSAIRYQPNSLKSCFFTKFNKNRMAIIRFHKFFEIQTLFVNIGGVVRQ